MILPIAFLFGGLIGWLRAAKRGGVLADKLLYGTVFGLLFMLAALIITLLADLTGIV